MADPKLGAGINTARKFPASFDAPLLLFVASAAGGVWIAYDKPAAWTQFALIVVGLALYLGLAHCPERIRLGQWGEVSLRQWSLGSLPTFIAIYFFLTNDWASRMGKVPALDPAMRWFAAWQPNVASLRLNSNVIGGVIAALLPLQVAALFQDRAGRRLWFKLLWVGLAVIGLLMSASRGAWLAISIVTAGWVLWCSFHRAVWLRSANQRTARAVWFAAMSVLLLGVVAFLVFTPWGEQLLKLRTDRLEVWRNSLDLASDYAFTGLGLGGFPMAYSSYALLVHVVHTIHAHNLFLDVWLNQGSLGLLAFVGLVVQAAWPAASRSRWRIAGLAALSVLILHGFLDDAFYGYGGWAIPFLFVPFAVLNDHKFSLKPVASFSALAILVTMVALMLPAARAAIAANLGTLAQTQAELSVYSNEKWGLQDALRRSSAIDLSPAMADYQFALVLNPANATANRRLGQIELSIGQYDAACHHLEAAWAAAPYQRATRQMLGECYAMAGDVDRATTLWQTLDLSEGQLDIRRSWHDYLGEKDYAAKISQAAQNLKK